jgi:hypothetical protein
MKEFKILAYNTVVALARIYYLTSLPAWQDTQVAAEAGQAENKLRPYFELLAMQLLFCARTTALHLMLR